MTVFVELTEFVELKTEDLVGAALDWAVAKAEGLDCGLWKKGSAPGYSVIIVSTFFCPSTKWADCGPLIEKHQISLDWGGSDGVAFWWKATHQDIVQFQMGDTPLIAACRAIVASVISETVSVPKELV